MKNTDEYRKLVAELLIGRKEQIPKGNGSASSMLEIYKSFQEVIKKLDTDLVNLGNHYVANNHPTTEQINELKEINKQTIKDFGNSLGIGGINMH